MTLETLAETIQETCDHCGKQVVISKEIYEQANYLAKHPTRETRGYAHKDLFVSFCGGIFCSRDCNTRYTED